MELLNIINFLFGATVSIFLAIIKIALIFVIGGIAFVKGYRAWIWCLATLILPWPFVFLIFLLITYLPKKTPKLPRKIAKDPAFEGKNPVIASIMALCAMIAKSDGSVTKEEIRFIKEFVKKYFGISSEELNQYSDAFDYGKTHFEDYLAFTDMINAHYRTRRDYVMALAYLFVGVALREGEGSAAKEEQTQRIIMALGISQYEYMVLKQAILRQRQFAGDEGYEDAGFFGSGAQPSQESLIKKYSEVLGVSEDASMAEIKKAYRKLVKEYHPDKLAAGSVPPEYIEFANQKIRDINEAYEYLEKVKSHA